MKKVLFIALLLCGIGWGAKAQTVAVKSNILYDATATVNLGAEVAFNRHWSLDISGNYNGWDVASDKSWKHWMVQPEARYWLHEKFNGHYFGVHGVYMDYDMSHVNFMSVMKKDFAYDGNAYGGGISYGVIGLGVESRWGSCKFKSFGSGDSEEDEQEPAPGKSKFNGMRVYLSFRF